MTWFSIRVVTTVAVAAVFSASCAETPVELPSATTLDVGIATVTLTAADEGISLAPVVLDQRGRPLLPQPSARYTSSAPSVALVSPGGFVTPLTPGTATVVVSFGAIADSVVVTVQPPVFDVSPATAQTVINGSSPLLVATARGLSGRNLLAFTQNEVRWSLERQTDGSFSDPASAQTSFYPAVAGTVRVFADYRGQRDTAVITVVQNESGLLTSVNLIQDSLPGLFSLMPTGDAARRVRLSATSAGGAERCQAILNNAPFTFVSRNPSVADVNTWYSNSCELEVQVGEQGATWMVFETNGLRDSVLVRVVSDVASLNIVQDSVVMDQGLPNSAQPIVTFTALDPRGQNQCMNSSVTNWLSTETRNNVIANAPSLLSNCRLRVEPGFSGPEGIGSTFVVLRYRDQLVTRDSLRVRGTSNALQFSNEGITAATSLNTLGLLAAGDTLRAAAPRQVAMRVVTRTGQPVAGATVTFTAVAASPASTTAAPGTFAPSTAVTDSLGVARSTYTPPAQLFAQTSSAPFLTLPVTITATGLGPQGQSVASTSGAVSSTAIRVFPGAASRLLVYRSNAGNAEDTTQVVTVDSLFVGQSNLGLRLRAYDANGNRISSTVSPAPLIASTRPEGATVSIIAIVPDGTWGLSTALPRDSTTVTFTLGSATRQLAVRARPTSSIVARVGGAGTNIILRSPYNDVAPPVTTVYTTPGGQSVQNPAFTGVRDTVAFTAFYDEGAGNFRGRTYLRPASGAGAATAVTPAAGATLAISSTYAALSATTAVLTVGYPNASFAPSTADRGTVYFISDSVTAGVGAVYARTAGGTLSTCVANTNPYVVPNGLAVNGDGSQLIVTTHGRLDSGTGTDSTTQSQVQVYSLPGCTLVSTLTSNPSLQVVYRAPSWVGSTLVIERVEATGSPTAIIRFGPMSLTNGAFTPWQTSFNFTGPGVGTSMIPSLDPLPGGRVLFNTAGTGVSFVDPVSGATLTPNPVTANVQQATYGRR